MIERIEPQDIIHKLASNKKFMWICHLKNSGKLVIRPTWDPSPTQIESEIKIIQSQFPDLVIFESYVEDSYDKIREFGLSHQEMMDGDMIKPIMMTFKNGWLKDNSIGKCYCTETLVELILDLHPEFLDGMSI